RKSQVLNFPPPFSVLYRSGSVRLPLRRDPASDRLEPARRGSCCLLDPADPQPAGVGAPQSVLPASTPDRPGSSVVQEANHPIAKRKSRDPYPGAVLPHLRLLLT